MNTKTNIILIGMPASGKSSAGIRVAQALGMDFVDSDDIIREQMGSSLANIIEEKGIDGFIEIENRINATLNYDHTVIATGGSAVYGEEAMKHFHAIGTIVYLACSCKELLSRIPDVKARGVVLRDEQTFDDLYNERVPLYERYADITVNQGIWDEDLLVDNLLSALSK